MAAADIDPAAWHEVNNKNYNNNNNNDDKLIILPIFACQE
jgi:hypothetical protein